MLTCSKCGKFIAHQGAEHKCEAMSDPLADLERLAQAAIAESNTIRFGSNAMHAFKGKCDPQTILSLISRVREAEKARDTNFATCADLEAELRATKARLKEATAP